MKVSIFKLKKNRRFNYTPRYFKGKDQGNLYDFDSKFPKYRDTYNKNDLGHILVLALWGMLRLELPLPLCLSPPWHTSLLGCAAVSAAEDQHCVCCGRSALCLLRKIGLDR